MERDDRVVELRPALPVPADQRWFWTARWQAMEHEVDDHVDAGRVVVLDGPDELLAHLDRDVEGATGILEMTWSFAGPDGRATFEWVVRAGEARVRWRRIGGHEAFREP